MKKNKINFRKILMYVILVMVAVGFTLPGFLEVGNDSTPPQTRICQADTDCYLTCNEKPFPVLCNQNLCEQNSCQQKSIYPYSSDPIKTNLEVNIQGESKDLTAYFNNKNFFVKTESDYLSLFTTGLTLNQVFEKFNSKLTDSCLSLGNQTYCRDASSTLKMVVNGNESYAYGTYTIQNGDQIKITYS